MKKRIGNIAASVIALCLLTACVSTPDAGPNYYLMSPGQLSAQAFEVKAFKLALGPVDVPAHLDREGIASHDGQNQLNYSDTHRWAEPLDDHLIKTLHANLAQLLPRQQLIDFPYRQSNRPDYQLTVAIDKFGYSSEGSVVLNARCVLLNAKGRQLDSISVNLIGTQTTKDYAAIVKSMSDLLSEMAVLLANLVSDKL